LAFEWKEDFQVLENNQRITKAGPSRYVVKNGIKNLVFFELEKIKNEISFFKDVKVEPIELSGKKVVVNTVEFEAAVLAMPAPQAARIVLDEEVKYALSQVKFNPVLVAWVALSELDKFSGIFVNQDLDISLLINEGSKQNDGANILTIYSTHEFASNEIKVLEGAKEKLIEKAKKLLNNSSNEIESGIMRWTLAQPEFATRPKLPSNLAIVGDAYAENPRIENAWLDGSRVLDQLSAIL
jgi:predicted NAD/FAD-dependent oxidoreductase